MSDQRNRKLLFISWTIPPAHGGSAYITHQLLKNFNIEECLAIGGTRNPFLFSKVYDGIKYHYLFSELNWKGHGDRFLHLFAFYFFRLYYFGCGELPERKMFK
ncbi:MAG: hypothetical protein IPM92_08840 [Saprospiraceae bacterium]|nr:hypothetical protein [Saprospiraceae bacterium]